MLRILPIQLLRKRKNIRSRLYQFPEFEKNHFELANFYPNYHPSCFSYITWTLLFKSIQIKHQNKVMKSTNLS
jgi:hypothetical protein